MLGVDCPRSRASRGRRPSCRRCWQSPRRLLSWRPDSRSRQRSSCQVQASSLVLLASYERKQQITFTVNKIYVNALWQYWLVHDVTNIPQFFFFFFLAVLCYCYAYIIMSVNWSYTTLCFTLTVIFFNNRNICNALAYSLIFQRVITSSAF